MSRLQKFLKLKEHPMLGSLIRKLSRSELVICQEFLIGTQQLNDDDFMLKANRWMLDQPKPKNYSAMWALVMQSK